jgi:hypothetical protein
VTEWGGEGEERERRAIVDRVVHIRPGGIFRIIERRCQTWGEVRKEIPFVRFGGNRQIQATDQTAFGYKESSSHWAVRSTELKGSAEAF